MRLTCLGSGLLILAFSCWAQAGGEQHRTARITGRVVNQQGQPLGHISVEAIQEQTGMHMPTAETNGSGHFVIEGLESGTYNIFGESDAAGYPNTSLSFYAHGSPTVVYAYDGETSEVTLGLGPVAGVWSVTILDRTTGETVVSAHSIHFMARKVLNTEDSIEFAGSAPFRWLIPADTDVMLEVHAEGYQPWIGLSPVRFKSGENKKMRIELERDQSSRSE
jgi:hypothetical protein